MIVTTDRTDQPIISAVVLQGNSRRWIETFYNHHEALVDEWCILDLGSRDGSAAYARTVPRARVTVAYQFNDRGGHCQDFGGARNYLLDILNPRGLFCLYLDTDECLSQRCFAEIRAVCQATPPTAYHLTQRNYVDRGYPDLYIPRPANDPYPESKTRRGWMPSGMVRLWRNVPGIRFRRRVHEVIHKSAAEAAGLRWVRRPEWPVHHFGWLGGTQQQRQAKAKRYLRLARLDYQDDPADVHATWALLQAYRGRKRYAKALKLARRGAALEPRHERWPLVAAHLLVCLGHLREAWAAMRAIIYNNRTYDGRFRLPDPVTGELRAVRLSTALYTPDLSIARAG